MRLIVTVGFAIGALLGMGGSFLPPGDLQHNAWFVSSAGLVVGLVLLAGRMTTEGRDQTAAGLVVLALAEVVLMTMAGSMRPETVFAHGVGLYVPGFLLVAASDRYPVWVRVVNVLTAVAFAAHWVLHVTGGHAPVNGPAAGVGYGLFVASLVGWTVDVWRLPAGRARPSGAPAG